MCSTRVARSSAWIRTDGGSRTTSQARIQPPIAGNASSLLRRGITARRGAQRPRQREHHVLLAALELFGGDSAPLAQPRHHLLHQLLGRRGAGGDTHGVLAFEPLALQERCIVDEVARPPCPLREL